MAGLKSWPPTRRRCPMVWQNKSLHKKRLRRPVSRQLPCAMLTGTPMCSRLRHSDQHRRNILPAQCRNKGRHSIPVRVPGYGPAPVCPSDRGKGCRSARVRACPARAYRRISRACRPKACPSRGCRLQACVPRLNQRVVFSRVSPRRKCLGPKVNRLPPGHPLLACASRLPQGCARVPPR